MEATATYCNIKRKFEKNMATCTHNRILLAILRIEVFPLYSWNVMRNYFA